MSEASGNGYKQLFAALAIGVVSGAGGTYTIADDYNKDITALKVEAAVNECRAEKAEYQIELLWKRLEGRP